MKSDKIVIGIDTSNYTTSLGILTTDGELVANIKIPLVVKEGERGLRQSDAVFSHIKNLPLIMERARAFITDREVICVGVSEKPRNADKSYMPCFLSGVAAAESFSAGANISLKKFSHQCGHIMAAVFSSSEMSLLNGDYFCVFHVSGGTTEMLRTRFCGNGFETTLIGQTADLNAGQVIDRVGVKLGLSFPCGPELEKLALKNTEKIPKKKISVKDFSINLSGLENLADKLYSETGNKNLVAAFVLDFVGRALIELANRYTDVYGDTKFLFAGGVMSNSIIKNMIKERFNAYFASPDLSSDNAVGIAALTLYTK